MDPIIAQYYRNHSLLDAPARHSADDASPRHSRKQNSSHSRRPPTSQPSSHQKFETKTRSPLSLDITPDQPHRLRPSTSHARHLSPAGSSRSHPPERPLPARPGSSNSVYSAVSAPPAPMSTPPLGPVVGCPFGRLHSISSDSNVRYADPAPTARETFLLDEEDEDELNGGTVPGLSSSATSRASSALSGALAGSPPDKDKPCFMRFLSSPASSGSLKTCKPKHIRFAKA